MSERFDDDAMRESAPPIVDSGMAGAPDLTGAGASEEDPAAIRADIAETRERLGDTLEQIGERLNPQNVKEQVKENVREATIGRVEDMARSAADRVNETRYTIMDTIRENPVPAAMVGIGLAWLFMNRRRNASNESRSRGAREGYAGPIDASDRYAAGEGRSAMESVRERAGELGQDVKETAESLAQGAQHAVGTVADRTQEATSDVARRTRRQMRRLENRFYESPLAVGAATLAAGVIVGLAIPETDKEAELMGDARDRVVDRAREVASATTDRVADVTERALDETTSTRSEPGIGGSQTSA